MKNYLLRAGLATALALTVVSAAFADERNVAVETLLKTKIEAVLSILRQANLTDDVKRQQVMEVISPVINFPLMAKLTLGKENWARLTPEERTRFVDLFVERLKSSYLDKTTLFSDQTVTYATAVEEAGKIHVPTKILTKDGAIEVIYRFYAANDQWQVYDVEIDGVSFIKSYRAQFDEVLKNGTVADLFAELSKTAENEAPAVEAGNQSPPEAPAGVQ